eukprot:gene2586-2888_t
MFHPLCARARGFYLAVRQGPNARLGGLQYKLYCGQHSDGQRQRDREAAERAAAIAAGLGMAFASGRGKYAAPAPHPLDREMLMYDML